MVIHQREWRLRTFQMIRSCRTRNKKSSNMYVCFGLHFGNVPPTEKIWKMNIYWPVSYFHKEVIMPHFVYPLRDNNATSNDQRVGSCTSIGGRDICRFFRCLAGGCEDGVGADGGERAGGEAPIRVDGVPERVCKSLRWSARTSSLFCLRGKSCQTALKFLSRLMS